MPPRATHVLLNPLADPNAPTPSSLDAVSLDLERELRFYGGLLIQQAGVMLELPQTVMSTAATLFQRFFFVTSLKHFGIRDVSAGALFLASKLEEKPARIRDIINVYDYLLMLVEWVYDQRPQSTSPPPSVSRLRLGESGSSLSRSEKGTCGSKLPKTVRESLARNLREKGMPVPPHLLDDSEAGQGLGQGEATGIASENKGKNRALQTDDDNTGSPADVLELEKFDYTPMDLFSTKFYDRKEEIVVAEMQILKRLGFHVQIQHPYSAMVNYLKVLELTDHPTLPQRAWNYLNDALLTPLPALYPSTHLATLSIYLSLPTASPPVPPLPPWWFELFDVTDEAELKDMARYLEEGVYQNGSLGWVFEDLGGKDPTDGGSPAVPMSKSVPATVWQRVAGLPVTKEGVRRRLEERR